MRRGLASLIMGLSLLVATASWAGFVLSRTVLDPGRSEALADTLLDDPEIRSTIVDRLADSAESQIPTDVPVTRDVVDAAAENALDDPRVEALIRDGLVRAHQNALNGIDEPVMLDGAALGAAGRDAVVAQQPDLDPFLPQAPTLEVELPSTGLSWLGTVKRYVDRYTLIGAIVAIAGVSAAFVLARNRAAALRRVAFWALGASAFWIAAAYALPWVLERIAPSSVSIASAAVDVFFGAMIRPAVTLASVGVGLLLLSFFWPAIERRRPAAMLDRAATPGPGAATATGRLWRRRPRFRANRRSIFGEPHPRIPTRSNRLQVHRPRVGHRWQHRPRHGRCRASQRPTKNGLATRLRWPTRPASTPRDRSLRSGATSTEMHRPRDLAPSIPPPPISISNPDSRRQHRRRAPGHRWRHRRRPLGRWLPGTSHRSTPTRPPRSRAWRPHQRHHNRHRWLLLRMRILHRPPRSEAGPQLLLTSHRWRRPPRRHRLFRSTRTSIGVLLPVLRPGFANATQVARPDDLAASRPPGAQAPRPAPAVAPAFDIDPDAAADADDFGAEWVEGAGYVDGDSAR